MDGTNLKVNYQYINITAETNNNTFTTVNTTAETVNEIIDDWNVTATTNSFEGNTWDINYTNLNITGTTTKMEGTTLTQDYSTVNIYGDTTNMTGNTLNVNYTNINMSGTTKIDGTLNITKNVDFDANLNVDGDTNISGKTTIGGDTLIKQDLTVEGDTNISGDTHIGGDTIIDGTLTVNDIAYFNKGIVIPSGYEFEGQLKEDLTFDSVEKTDQIYNNTKAITINYVDNRGDTINDHLKVNGTLEVTSTSSFGGNMSVTGTITASSAIYSSDKDLKENIKKINKYDIATVADVELKSYKFIDDETHRERYGVIAQDLESVGLEHLVVKGENGKKGVDYISFLILKIAQLEKEIEELRNKK